MWQLKAIESELRSGQAPVERIEHGTHFGWSNVPKLSRGDGEAGGVRCSAMLGRRGRHDALVQATEGTIRIKPAEEGKARDNHQNQHHEPPTANEPRRGRRRLIHCSPFGGLTSQSSAAATAKPAT